MEHKDVRFDVVQTASPTGWKWTVYIPGRRPKSGTTINTPMAIQLAETAIDRAIRVKSLKSPPAKQ